MTDYKPVFFRKEKEEVKLMAYFIAILVIEGIEFYTEPEIHGWHVVITGGY